MTIAAGRFTAWAFPPNTAVSVCSVGMLTLSSLYTDKINGTAASNPVTSSENGSVNFFAVPGDYDLVWQANTIELRETITVPADPTEGWPG